MNRTADELFPRAGLSMNENRRVGGGNLSNFLEDRRQRRTFTDDFFEVILAFDLVE